ncbi:hypothetical protein ACWGS9_13805 [Bradyrhizobium sp. Arg314]
MDLKFPLMDLPAYEAKAGPFEIDGIVVSLLRGGKLAPWAQAQATETALLALGRRTLHVALMKAFDAHHAGVSDSNMADWVRTAKLAGKASTSLDLLMANLSGLSTRNLEAIEAVWLEKPLKIVTIPHEKGEDVEALAADLAKHLVLAQKGLAMVARRIESNRRRLKGTRKNQGERAKNAFVQTLSEAWAFMTGVTPAATTPALIDFVQAAWGDAGGSTRSTDFTRAIQASTRALKATPKIATSAYWPEWVQP